MKHRTHVLAVALAAVLAAPAAGAQAAQAQPAARASAPAPRAQAAQGQPAPARAAAPAPARVDATFVAWDLDHNGALSLQEFTAGWHRLRQAAAEERLRAQFHAVDADRNGAIGAGEYGQLQLVKAAGKSAPPLSAFDADGNRQLEFAEYMALVRKLATVPAREPAPATR